MLDKLSCESFTPLVGNTFHLANEAGGDQDLTLVEAVEITGTAADRKPFSLVFQSQTEDVLPQSIHTLEHASLGRLDIFLVPLGPSKEGMRYEAVFT